MNHASNVTFYILIFTAFLLIQACSSSRSSLNRDEPLSDGQIAVLDSLMNEPTWHIPTGKKKVLPVRTWNLHHQKIDIVVDFEDRGVYGTTTLFLTSIAQSNDTLSLDARHITVDSLFYSDKAGALSYRQDSTRLHIGLDKAYQSGDSLFITIRYHAYPENRGLHFIDPENQDPTLSTQVYTLGNPYDVSHWLPTVAHPAERASQETHLTVPDSMKTVSNGRMLTSRTQTDNGLRTDFWLLEKPHPTNHFSFAAGSFTIKKSVSDGIFYRYYTEPEYEAFSELIYQPTREIGRFLQNYLDFPYPWYVYQQVPVRMPTASGIANTSAPFFFEAVQFDQRAAQDVNNQNLITRLFASQWFGNLLSAENWANTAVSRGLSRYFEILFRQHKQGTASADWQKYQAERRYLNEARRMRRPIIFEEYQNPDQLSDAHSRYKMVRVLHMLHQLVGEEVWKSSLQYYVSNHQFETVNYGDLQRAFERHYGKRLTWFFEQWLLKPGHPELEISVDTTNTEKRIHISQIHDINRQPVFRLPVQLQWVTTDSAMNRKVWLNGVDSSYTFSLAGEIKDVIIDPQDELLAEINHTLSLPTLYERLQHTSVPVRIDAINRLRNREWNQDIKKQIMAAAREDPFWGIRKMSMELLTLHKDSTLLDFAYKQSFTTEPAGRVRIFAIQMVDGDTTAATRQYLEKMLQDTSYFVAAEAIKVYGKSFPEVSYNHLSHFRDVPSYKQVIKSAFAQAMRYSADSRATGDLTYLAKQKGDYQYIRDALRSLAVRVQQNIAEPSALKEVCYTKLTDPYLQNRNLCVDLLKQFATYNDISDLEYMLNNVAVHKEVVKELQNLKNELESASTAKKLN